MQPARLGPTSQQKANQLVGPSGQQGTHQSAFQGHTKKYPVEMSHFLPNPSPSRNRYHTSFGWAQHQAQHSSMGPTPSPSVFSFTIRLLMLSPARSQQPHVRPRKSPVRARRPAQAGARGLELDIYRIHLVFKGPTRFTIQSSQGPPASGVQQSAFGGPNEAEGQQASLPEAHQAAGNPPAAFQGTTIQQEAHQSAFQLPAKQQGPTSQQRAYQLAGPPAGFHGAQMRDSVGPIR